MKPSGDFFQVDEPADSLIFFISQQYHGNLLRSCFYHADSSATQGHDVKLAEKLKGLIQEDLDRQLMVVRGSDRESRVVVYKPQRQSPTDEVEHEAYILSQIYTAERAIASTAYISKGQQEKLFVIFSFAGYASKNSVSTSTMKESSTVLQRIYPERLKTLVVLDPPFWIRALFKIMYPFLSYATREKMQLVSGKVRGVGQRAPACSVGNSRCVLVVRRKRLKKSSTRY